MRYREALSALIERGEAGLALVALGHRAGFRECLSAWIEAGRRDYKDFDERRMRNLFDACMSGDAGAIEAAALADVRATASQETSGESEANRLDHHLAALVDILIYLERVDVLLALHERSTAQAGTVGALTAAASRTLGEAGDWANALAILQQALDRRGPAAVHPANFKGLLRAAYFHRVTEIAFPVFARFEGINHEWDFLIYQLRAGVSDVRVPLLLDDQPYGYLDAVATEIAALEGDPSAASRIQQLYGVVNPRPILMQFPERGVAFSVMIFSDALARARSRIAARRKDHAKARALARKSRGDSLLDNPTLVIDAFLDEGDWRSAAMIGTEHDERNLPPIEGLNDDRLTRYVDLQRVLAALAACDGDDSAAAIFLHDAKAADDHESARLEAAEVAEWMGYSPEQRAKLEADAVQGKFTWLETVLAGAAEGLLPRRFISLMVPISRPG
jgi:hypothetical protein